MDLASLQQYGMAAIFIVAAWRFYTDMRNDSTKREDLLMKNLEKQSETSTQIAETLKKIDARLCELERCGKND